MLFKLSEHGSQSTLRFTQISVQSSVPVNRRAAYAKIKSYTKLKQVSIHQTWTITISIMWALSASMATPPWTKLLSPNFIRPSPPSRLSNWRKCGNGARKKMALASLASCNRLYTGCKGSNVNRSSPTA